ncbi:MAG: hypothetical protein AAFN50_04405 [Pseudomonadota bacterium]
MSKKTSILIRVIIYVVALLSIAAGVPKVMQMPQELGFLSSLGLQGLAVSALGVVQIAGGVLFAMNQYRLVGAVLAGAAFLVSSIALLVGGNIPFGLFSLLPIAVLLVVARADRRARA